jgi:predicted nuclease with TOPRIM domain
MKGIQLLLLLSITGAASDLKSLEADLAKLESERARLQEQMTQVESKLSDLKKQLLAEKLKGVSVTESRMEVTGNLYETGNVYSSKKLKTIEESTPVKVTGYDAENKVYQIAVGDLIGYVINRQVVETPEMIEH